MCMFTAAVGIEPARVSDVNQFRLASVEDTTDEGAAVSSPNSAASYYQMDFSIMNGNGDAAARNSSREEGADRNTSDDEENGSTRKKLRLSKEQSAFLEDSFKEHTTLNPVIITSLITFHLFDFLFLVLCYRY